MRSSVQSAFRDTEIQPSLRCSLRRICRRTPSSRHWRRISSHPSSDTESFRDFAAAYKSADLLTYNALFQARWGYVSFSFVGGFSVRKLDVCAENWAYLFDRCSAANWHPISIGALRRMCSVRFQDMGHLEIAVGPFRDLEIARQSRDCPTTMIMFIHFEQFTAPKPLFWSQIPLRTYSRRV